MKVITQDSIATIGFGQILWSGRGEQGADALKLPTIFFLQVISSRDNPPLLDQLMDLDGWECNKTHGNQKHKNGPFQSAIFRQSPSDRRIHNGNTFRIKSMSECGRS